MFTRLAGTPQGIWLTPEEYPAGSVGPFVAQAVAAADKAGQVPTFVVYGIPDRDCTGQHSAGGLPADQYGPWVGEIADAAGAGGDVAAVVEPDGLSSLLECGDRDERVGLIADAAHRLADAGVTTYIDGGHSHWIEPAELAPLLEDAGVADVRGFSTNVSNFQTDEDEQAYGEELSALLDGAHYVVDSGRNGFGATKDWCNPPGRAFGTEPGAVVGRRAPRRLRVGEAARRERRRVRRRAAGRAVLGRAGAGAGRRVRLVRPRSVDAADAARRRC